MRGSGDLESFLLSPPFQPASKNGAIREVVVVEGQFHMGITGMTLSIAPLPHGPPQLGMGRTAPWENPYASPGVA